MNDVFLTIFLGLFAGSVGGGLFYLGINWSHIRFELALEGRVTDVEARLQREVKIARMEKFQDKKRGDSQLLEEVKNLKAEPELNLKTWRERAFTR